MARVLRLDAIDFALRSFDWQFATERRTEIEAHFTRLREANDALWNGRVLLTHAYAFDGATLRGDFFETDFANFVAWRDFGFPDLSVQNTFALGALQGSDGAYLMGVMGPRTMNGGKIYFPGGTPDPSDIRGDRVDLEASVRREVAEETGLGPDMFEVDNGWHCVVAGPMIALLKPMRAREPAECLRERILGHIARQEHSELSDAVVVRDANDIAPSMPGFIQAFLRSAKPE